MGRLGKQIGTEANAKGKGGAGKKGEGATTNIGGGEVRANKRGSGLRVSKREGGREASKGGANKRERERGQGK